MTDEEFEKIWASVESVIRHVKMQYDESIVIGGAFGQLRKEIERLREENDRLTK
jgi:hypothetical protein